LFFLAALVFQGFDFLPSLLISSAELALMAGEHAEGLGFGQLNVGGLADRDRISFGSESFLLLAKEFLEKGGFHFFDAAETPTGGGHFVDEFALEFADGVEVFRDAGFEAVELFLRFVREDDAGAGESMREAVPGRSGFSLFGDWADRLGSVYSGRFCFG
jgi:hypothetical protein